MRILFLATSCCVSAALCLSALVAAGVVTAPPSGPLLLSAAVCLCSGLLLLDPVREAR